MKLNKKIMMGTLATSLAIATPVALVVSCGSNKEKYSNSYGDFDYEDNIGEYLTLKKVQENNPNTQQIMSGNKLRDIDGITDAQFEKMNSITLDIQMSDKVIDDIKVNYKKKAERYEGFKAALGIKFFVKEEFDSKFFESLTDKENAKKWADRLTELHKNNKFQLNFNLTLPKILTKYELGISLYTTDIASIVSVEKEDPAIKVNSMQLSSLKNIDISKLPSELKVLELLFQTPWSANKLPDSVLNLGNMPKGLEALRILGVFSDAKDKEIKTYIKNHNLDIEEAFNNPDEFANQDYPSS